MANYTTTITNEGAALLASVIANQGTLTFNEFRFSENDYTGQELTLTEGTFLGVFITASAAASVIDLTTIKASAQFDNSTITGNHDLYSIGIIGTDGNTTALIAVCTTTDPDVIREPLTGTSTYAFNVNLTVSDTSQITVVGTTAAVIYDIDVIDNLTSPATNKPLSANQGLLIADNLAADEESGAKNLNVYPYKDTTKSLNGITFTDNGDGTITVNGTATTITVFDMHLYLDNPCIVENGTYILSGCPSGGGISTYNIRAYEKNSGGTDVIIGNDYGNGVTLTLNGDYYDNDSVHLDLAIVVASGAVISTPITFKPMLRDARILDPTFAPYAETNLQLTRKTSGLTNENLLDNGWFTVNQRGATTVTSGFGADRWQFVEGTSATYSSNGVSLNNSFICQVLENQLPNGLYTASVKYQDGTIEHGTAIKADNSTAITFFTSSTGFKLMYIPLAKRFDVNGKNGSTTSIRAVKLELGSVSTLANDVEPNYTAELLKCQRYFYRLTNADQISISFASSTDTATAIFNLPVPMRITPTLTQGGSFYLRYMGTNEPVTNIAKSGSNNERVGLAIITSGTLTIGQAGYFNASSVNSFLDFSADL